VRKWGKIDNVLRKREGREMEKTQQTEKTQTTKTPKTIWQSNYLLKV
jgi:hypothetical protein